MPFSQEEHVSCWPPLAVHCRIFRPRVTAPSTALSPCKALRRAWKSPKSEPNAYTTAR